MHISVNAFRFTSTSFLLVALTIVQFPSQVRTQGVPVAGLVAAYGFDEASGSSVLDASGNNLTGTIAGATRVAGGKFGGALSFNGTNSTVTVNSATALNLTTGMTLEAWVNPTALGNAWRNVMIKERSGGEAYNLYAHSNTGRPVVYVVRASAPTSPQDAQGTTAIPVNTWTHLAATYDGATLRLYVNGTQVGSRTVSGALVTSTGALRIGGNSIWGEYFAGLIDEIRIYNRALTVAEIQADMVTPVGTPSADVTPPVRSNGQPSSPLPAGTTQATLSLTTNETATCRYSTLPGVAYSAMTTTFTNTNATTHSTQVTGLTDGSSSAYYVRCQDSAGNPNTDDFTISVAVNQPGGDGVAPTVSLTSPANAATVSGAVSVTADASDNVAVAGVQFLLDGVNLGPEDTTAPYGYSWDTSLATPGSHTLMARARDAAGNTATSAGRTVTVSSGTLPGNFYDELVIGTGVTYPTAFEFLPDGRMLIAEFMGKIIVVQPGNTTVDATAVLQLTNVISEEVTAGGERGLVNVIADPSFSTNGYIYIFYTSGSPQRDRVSRFTMVGNAASLDSEQIIWQSVATSSSTDHHGGGLGFGPDGKLYITTGDNGEPSTVQSLTSDHGKILRYNADGTIPADNPFNDLGGSNLDAIWARGLRNPYRFSFDVPTGQMYIGDVGSNSAEEVNVGQAGANYGWPTCEGPCGLQGMKDPIFSYPRDGHDSAVIGGFVYRGSQFPAVYQGKYFFADFARNYIRYLTLDASGTVTGESVFLPADGSLDSDFDPVMLKQAPDGSLYYSDFGWGWLASQNPAAIRRIRFVSGNQPPTAVASAQPTTGLAPLSVSFSSAGSVDPENQALTYLWTFGDGSQSTEANPVYVYTLSGAYGVQLSVSDGTNTTQSSVLGISVGTPPVAAINSPLNGATFKAGDVLTFSGSATDAEDGVLPASAYSWMVLFHHDTHVHPALGPLNGVTSGTFTIPSSGHDFSGATSYEFVLTATDSTGLQHTSPATVSPRKVDLTLTTNPPNLNITVDGVPKATPFVKDTLVGFQHTIEAPAQVVASFSYTFSSWSDGGPLSHSITVPEASQTFTATFQAATAPPVAGLVAAYNFNEASGATVIDSSGNNLTGTIAGATRTTGGRFGSALSFNGTSNMVTVNSAAPLNLTSGMTLEAWVNPTTLGSAWRNVLMKERANGETYNLYGNTDTGGPTIYTVLTAAPNAPAFAATATRLTASAWTHLAATYDGTTLRLYVNGIQVATRVQTGAMVTSTGALRIGGNSIWGEYFAGLIDEVRVYNRALTPTEIQTDMITPVGAPPPTDTTPPVRSNGQPSSALPAGTTQTTLSLTTNETATCRYSTTAGVPYGSMTNTFSVTNGTSHSTPVTGLTNGGSYTFYVRCQDAAANANPDDFAIAFSVSQPGGDTIPPVVAITAPADSSSVTGTVQVTASATDNVGVVGVQFLLDGANLGSEDTTAPYAYAWNTTTATAGPHTLAARARDAAGNTTTSPLITVAVSSGPLPSLSINNATVTEGDTGAVNATFTVTLSATSSQPVTVNYATLNGTAVAAADYVATNGALTFSAGTQTMQLVVPVVGDLLDENAETYTVSLSGASGATIGTASGTGTITDNDASPSLTINSVSVTEGNAGTTAATFTVTLSAISGRPVAVSYATANGTATTASGDYTAVTTTPLTFAPGVTTQTLNVSVRGDTLHEAAETFRVNLSGATNATIATSQGTGTILNDDPPPALSISSPVVTETNAGSTTMTFVVSLPAVSAVSTTVNFATADGTATAGTDYTARTGTLTIAAGSLSGNIAITRFGDTVPEANETLFVDLSGPTNATIAQSRGTGTITDNDGTVTVTAPNTAVTWTVGSARVITWTTSSTFTAGATFQVELSRDGGTTYELLAASVPNATSTSGSYNWTVTGPVTTQGRVRVTWTVNNRVTDISNSNCTIGP